VMEVETAPAEQDVGAGVADVGEDAAQQVDDGESTGSPPKVKRRRTSPRTRKKIRTKRPAPAAEDGDKSLDIWGDEDKKNSADDLLPIE